MAGRPLSAGEVEINSHICAQGLTQPSCLGCTRTILGPKVDTSKLRGVDCNLLQLRGGGYLWNLDPQSMENNGTCGCFSRFWVFCWQAFGVQVGSTGYS